MRNRLQRLHGRGDLHFVTFSRYRRRPFLATPRARHRCVKILEEGRNPTGTLTGTATSTPAPFKIKGMRHPALPLRFDFSLRRAVEISAPLARV